MNSHNYKREENFVDSSRYTGPNYQELLEMPDDKKARLVQRHTLGYISNQVKTINAEFGVGYTNIDGIGLNSFDDSKGVPNVDNILTPA